MPLFASDAEVYEHLGRLIQDAVADDELWAAIARADAVVQLALYEPEQTPPAPLGHSTDFPEPTLLLKSWFWVQRKLVKMKLVPLPSVRCAVVIP